jgi:YVTN family beta-propeller protein
MKTINLILPLAIVVAAFTSCEKSNNPSQDTGYSKGIYIINEGTFNTSNGSISFFDPSEELIVNGIFEAANNRPLGDVVQSFSVVQDSLGCIVVNNSFKLEFVSLKTFKTTVEPIQVTYPRYFIQVDDSKGYLSTGQYQGYIQIIDLNSFSKTDSIKVGFGPETMLLLSDKVYVANSGGWGSDSTISVIDPVTDEVIDTIRVGKVPVDMAVDFEDNIWVYCKGYTNYAEIETDAMIQKINPLTNEIIWETKVGRALDYSATPAKCASSADGSSLYYLRPDGVYEISAMQPGLSETPLITGNFYGLEVNPEDGNIYVFESSFTGTGKMKIYDQSGNFLVEGVVGIGPSGAVFNL